LASLLRDWNATTATVVMAVAAPTIAPVYVHGRQRSRAKVVSVESMQPRAGGGATGDARSPVAPSPRPRSAAAGTTSAAIRGAGA
jgi:hypothetical protein